MTFEINRCLALLCEDPADFSFTLKDMASKIMCQLTWEDTSFSAYFQNSAWGLLTQMSPAGPITNVLTLLWHLPDMVNPWNRAERKRHDEQQAFWMERPLEVRAKMQRGEARPSFTRQYLETGEKLNLSGDYEASSVIGMMALIGIFTIAGPLHYFLMAMVFHQHWLAQCQKEIDEVYEGRLPRLHDSPNLPILRACILEKMRWRPNVPTGESWARPSKRRLTVFSGVSHEVEADDFYQGVFIEKGTRILPLDWYACSQI